MESERVKRQSIFCLQIMSKKNLFHLQPVLRKFQHLQSSLRLIHSSKRYQTTSSRDYRPKVSPNTREQRIYSQSHTLIDAADPCRPGNYVIKTPFDSSNTWSSLPSWISISTVILTNLRPDRYSGKSGRDSDAKFKRDGRKRESEIAEVVPRNGKDIRGSFSIV